VSARASSSDNSVRVAIEAGEHRGGRNEHEQEFHDRWAMSIAPSEVLVDPSWSAATAPEHRWIREQLGDVKGKRVLDLGCGAGEAAVWFAKQGADVVASDLSPAFLNLVRRVAALHGVEVETHLADADRLDLAPESFDVVYTGNLLHHVDIDETLERIERVLKPGGVLVSWDPLRHNPVINLYRRMAAGVRTEDEHPFDVRDVERYRRLFEDVRCEFFWLATLWLFVRFYLIERVHPRADRYWKRVVREHERLTSTYNRLARVDRVLLRTVPSLRKYCWNVAIYARKRGSGAGIRAHS
jgi:ubiquinone/menaquinone biosynthesis C-methylase UbiE